MSDDVTRLDLDRDDAALDRTLRELGPLMRRQELLDDAEPDAAFASNLRAHLTGTGAESDAPDPAFARDLRDRLVGSVPHRDVTSSGAPPVPANDAPAPGVAPIPIDRQRRHGRPAMWAGLAAALVAALAVAIALNLPGLRQPHNATTMAVGRAPAPSLHDIIRGYPLCGPGQGCGGGGGSGPLPPPEQSVFDQPEYVQPFYSPLRLSTSALQRMPATLPAYELAGAPNAADVAAVARRLGITATVGRETYNGTSWLAAASRMIVSIGKVPTRYLHSISVSTVSGKLVYHDTQYESPPFSGRVQDRSGAIATARALVSQLGWPAARMAVQAATLPQGGDTWTITLGWPGIGPVNMAAASLIVTPGGHVSEARLWPLVTRAYRVQTRPVAGALDLVRQGKVPLAVTETSPIYGVTVTDGRGAVRQVTVESTFTANKEGRLYLVPAYRFAGTVRFQGTPLKGNPPVHGSIGATWYALVPAQQ